MKLDKRRRIEGKTDYRARMEMLKSGIPRIVARKTNRYIILQYVKSEEAKDKIIYGFNSKELLELGWDKEAKGSLKSLPACYLSGYCLGKKIIEREKKVSAIFDIGLARNLKGSRLYAALKGLIDAGVKIPHNESIFKDSERFEGKHLDKNVQKNIEIVKSKIK
ncbi:MAG: 50S ribosomal protein L18 [Nanoarchaeota archaeon]